MAPKNKKKPSKTKHKVYVGFSENGKNPDIFWKKMGKKETKMGQMREIDRKSTVKVFKSGLDR